MFFVVCLVSVFWYEERLIATWKQFCFWYSPWQYLIGLVVETGPPLNAGYTRLGWNSFRRYWLFQSVVSEGRDEIFSTQLSSVFRRLWCLLGKCLVSFRSCGMNMVCRAVRLSFGDNRKRSNNEQKLETCLQWLYLTEHCWDHVSSSTNLSLRYDSCNYAINAEK